MARALAILLSYLVLLSTLLIPSSGHPSLPGNHVALFIFGDSIFDAGNNNYINTTTNYQANFCPYGETFFHYPTGRFSDGRLVPDFIAEHADLPLIPTFLPFGNHKLFIYGVNFASAGAGALAETNQGLAIDLKTQVSYLKIVKKELKKKLGDAGARTLISKAVYLFSIGGNDYHVPITTNSSVSQSDYSRKVYVDMVIGNLTTSIKEVYTEGGRKFGFVNVGPLGCVPAMKALVPGGNGSCLEIASELAKLHNEALSKILLDIESQLKGFRYANYDFYNSAIEIINNPSKFGIKEVNMACCGSGPFRGSPSCGGKRGMKEYELCDNPEEYLFFDDGHPTEKANKQIAESIWSGKPNVIGPYNLKTLFGLL